MKRIPFPFELQQIYDKPLYDGDYEYSINWIEDGTVSLLRDGVIVGYWSSKELFQQQVCPHIYQDGEYIMIVVDNLDLICYD